MSAAKHTPKPWRAYRTAQGNHCIVDARKPGPNQPRLAHTERGGGELTVSREEEEANANLLAAAPTLLKALECLLEPTYSRKTAEHKARAALASARGPKPARVTCEVCGVRLKETDVDGRCYMHSHAREGTEATK